MILIKILAVATGVELRWVQRIVSSQHPPCQPCSHKPAPSWESQSLALISCMISRLVPRPLAWDTEGQYLTDTSVVWLDHKVHGSAMTELLLRFWPYSQTLMCKTTWKSNLWRLFPFLIRKKLKRRHNQSGKQLMREKSSPGSLPCSTEVLLSGSSVQINFVSIVSVVLGLRNRETELLTEMAGACL